MYPGRSTGVNYLYYNNVSQFDEWTRKIHQYCRFQMMYNVRSKDIKTICYCFEIFISMKRVISS